MKTLAQVEPRTPISSIPVTITQSGSYYLTRDMGPAAQDTNGVTIQVDNVTIDLNGFTLIGAGKAVGTSGSAIVLDGTRYNVAIRNGTIRDWRAFGILGSGGCNSQIESLRCYNNGYDGIAAGQGSIIRGNCCYENGESGISAAGPNTLCDNTCMENKNGIVANGGSTILGNTCYHNSELGIRCSEKGNTVSFNTCSFNGTDGIYISNFGGCQIVNNTCSSNGNGGDGAGIHALGNGSCIEHNLVCLNDRGIDVDWAGNYIASNRASANTTNYDIAGGNTQGAGDLANVSF
jgi:parallel beta-helix repeat protein